MLILVMNDSGSQRVAIFDTALNLRGYMEDGQDSIETDGVGFVDHDGNFVIGKMELTSFGTAEPSELGYVDIPNHYSNTAVIPYTHSDSSNYYLEVLTTGDVRLYDDIWTYTNVATIGNYTDTTILHQNDRHFSDLVFASSSGDIFVYTKSQLYDHSMGTTIDLNTPTLSISSNDLSGFGARCSRGYFVSTYSGDYVLFGTAGDEIDRVENDDDYNEVITIDYDCEYYYYINRDKGLIVKERLPF